MLLIRFFDVLISIFVLFSFFPLMILISLLILLTDGRPVIFKQYRIGYREENLKFLNLGL